MWFLIHNLISPKKFNRLTQCLLPWLSVSFLVLVTFGTIDGLFFVPKDYLQGDAFRIIYIHVPCAFLSLLIYSVMAIAAFIALVFRIKLAFHVMNHSVSLGAGFTFLALVTGSIWGKPMWGTWWIWDARLTSELILLFLYLAILLLQSALYEKRQGNRAVAVLVLVGFVDIPIIHYSVYWWNTLHQGATITRFAKPAMDPIMLYPLLAMIAAFILYFSMVLLMRIRNHTLIEQEQQVP